ncbi:RNA-binding protein [Emticicia sp. CRIBPO]|nr:RNA-binding protein [Emticicia sp. CRIBPO]
MKFNFTILIFFVFIFFSCKEKTLFQKLTTEETGVSFTNNIVENDTMNIIKFEYIYNGGGVAIADFNSDGLQDLFFSGNQVQNKLYLNKGDFKFEDVSKPSGIDGFDRWNTGVVTVDVNGDGLMDIYVAASVKQPASKRENLLFVNQGVKGGVPVFKEMGKEYGVNDDGHSENATFFDYDNDGDLDLYVVTNVIDQYPNFYRPKKTDGSNPNTDRLYRCDWSDSLKHPVYTNVSKEAGILIEGFGLGVNICDINNDGWKDIYVTNDYASDDLFYVNNKNGTFTDKAADYFKHTSNSAMGNDIADINNDGLLDIIALDMLPKNNLRKKVLAPANNYQLYNFSDQYGYIYQYMRNTLQLNNGIDAKGEPKFSEISLLSGVAETDWSWTPSLADFDNDGFRDLFVTNGFPKDVTDRDFMAFRADAERLAGIDYLLSQIPEVKISNYAFRNKGDLTFENVTKSWGFDIPSFSNGAAYGDLDNDGDLDYVINNINDPASIYKNTLMEEKGDKKSDYLRISFKGNDKNTFGYGAVAEAELTNRETLIHEHNPHRGYLSSVEPYVHFGLGEKVIKTLRIRWQNGKMQEFKNVKPNQVLVVDIKNANLESIRPSFVRDNQMTDITQLAGIDFKHREYDFIDFNQQNLLPSKLSQLGPAMATGDINGDGLDDIFMSGPKFINASFFVQGSDGKFQQKFLLPAVDSLQKKGEDLGSLLFDADLDGDLDLYIARGGSEDHPANPSFQDVLYLNDGKGGFTVAVNALPESFLSKSCVRASDFDHDGDLDLLVAGRNVPLEYPKPTSSKLLRNDTKNGVVKFTDVTASLAPGLNDIGLICDVLWTDYDNDGWADLILAGEWMPVTMFKNEKGKLVQNQKTGLEAFKGLWNSLNGGDFDGDGDIDYVVGNLGKNNLMKGTALEPVKVLAKDFDNNGNYDLIPFVYFDGVDGKRQLVPFNGKDDVNKQLNPTRARFVSYKDFAGATYDNLLAEEARKGALELEMNYTSSAYIENLGNGSFKITELPVYAQFSVVNGMLVKDLDQDGNLDVLISGNNYGNETSIGRYDASNGIFLKGDGKGNFTVKNYSGFYAPGDAKALVSFYDGSGNMLIASAENRGKLRLFRTKIAGEVIQLQPKSTGVIYNLRGKKLKSEVYYGSSYLSQSSRKIVLPAGAKFISEY